MNPAFTGENPWPLTISEITHDENPSGPQKPPHPASASQMKLGVNNERAGNRGKRFGAMAPGSRRGLLKPDCSPAFFLLELGRDEFDARRVVGAGRNPHDHLQQ
jgi:hypothetical protein